MNTRALISLSLELMLGKYDAWRLKQEIKRTERDIDLTKKEIAEKLEAKSNLQMYLKHLKRGQPMKPIQTCRAGRLARRWSRFLNWFSFLQSALINL